MKSKEMSLAYVVTLRLYLARGVKLDLDLGDICRGEQISEITEKNCSTDPIRTDRVG